MALKKSGVILVAENYQQYLQQLSTINKAQRDTFSGKGMTTYNRAQGQAKQGASALGSTISGLSGYFKVLAVALVGVKLKQFASQSIDIAARNETLRVSLEQVGSFAGYTREQIDWATESLKRQGITTAASQQSLMRMARANISWAEATKLAAIAQGSAVVAGMNSSQAFERLILGIQKMEPELLDELGIQLNRTKAYQAFAAEVGKTSKTLTEAEKKQAILNEIYRQSESVLGVYDAAMGTTAKQQGSLARHIEETQNELGKMLLPLRAASVSMQTEFWEGARQVTKGLALWGPLIGNTIKQLQTLRFEASLPPDVKEAYDGVKKSFTDLGVESADAAASVKSIVGDIKEGATAKEVVEDLTKQFQALGMSNEEAATKAQEMAQTIMSASSTIKGAEMFSIWERMGRGAQIWGRVIVETGSLIVSSYYAVRIALMETANEIAAMTSKTIEMMQALAAGDLKNASLALVKLRDQAEDFGSTFETSFKESASVMHKEGIEFLKKKFPELYTEWDKLGQVAETSLERTNNAITETVDTLDTMKQAITEAKATFNALKKVEDIYENYQESLTRIQEQYVKDRQNTIEDAAKQEARIRQDAAKQAAKIAAEFSKKIAATDREYQKSVAENTRAFQLEQANKTRSFQASQLNELRRHQLAMQHAQLRFELQDRRLRADGDILALMELRENHKMQQQESKDSFSLQREEQKKQLEESKRLDQQRFDEELRQLQMERDERKRAAKEERDEQMAELRTSTQEQLAELRKSTQERLTELEEARDKQIEAAKEQRDEAIKELGKQLQEQGDMTKEGMDSLAEAIGEVFGDGAVGDELIKGWTERSTSEIGQMVLDAQAQLAALEAAVSSASNAAATASQKVSNAFSSKQPTLPSPTMLKDIPMRQGGVGVVTGPATFSVEPGQREAVMFAPLPAQGNLNVKMSGGFDLRGAEVAGKAATEAALDLMVNSLEAAARRVVRRS